MCTRLFNMFNSRTRHIDIYITVFCRQDKLHHCIFSPIQLTSIRDVVMSIDRSHPIQTRFIFFDSRMPTWRSDSARLIYLYICIVPYQSNVPSTTYLDTGENVKRANWSISKKCMVKPRTACNDHRLLIYGLPTRYPYLTSLL